MDLAQRIKDAEVLMDDVINEGWYIGPDSGDAWERLIMKRVPAPMFYDLLQAAKAGLPLTEPT